MSSDVEFEVQLNRGTLGGAADELFLLLRGRSLTLEDVGSQVQSRSGDWSATLTDCSRLTKITHPTQVGVVSASAGPEHLGDDEQPGQEAKYLRSDHELDPRASGEVARAKVRLSQLVGAPVGELVMNLTAILAMPGLLSAWSTRQYGRVLPFLGDMDAVSPLILVSGDPGTGKSVASESAPWLVAERLGESIRLVRTNEQVRGEGIQGRAGAVIGELFDGLAAAAERRATPCVVVIDEADTVLSSRGVADLGSGATENTAAVNSFLVNLDRLGRAGARVAFVAITNLPDRIDPAVVRRAQLLKFDRLDRDEIYRVLTACLGDTVSTSVLERAADELSDRVPSVTGSDVFQQVIFPTTRAAVRSDARLDENILLEFASKVVPTSAVVDPRLTRK